MPTTYQRGQVIPGTEVVSSPLLVGGLLTPTSGIQAGGGQPTLTALTAAGLAAAVSAQVGTDQAGSFLLTAGTASTAGGSQVSVTFATPLPSAPAAVNVTYGNTSGTTQLAAGALSLTTTGFVIASAAPTASSAYLVCYQVIRQT
jgi:hypothetical protein